MLLTLSTIRNHSVVASDGDIGTVNDVLFDDTSWMIRWLVVDTGGWLSGRKVLLPPSALGHADPQAKTFSVRLTKAQIEASPGLDSHRPVSRQFETSTYDYYGWSPYWGSGYYMGGYGMIPMSMDREVERRHEDIARQQHDQDEPHLRSAATIIGYHIHASDGEIGHLSDLVLEDTDWSVHFLIVDTSNWWMGQKVLISPRSATNIRWTEQLVYLDVNRQTIKDSPSYDPLREMDRADEDRLAEYYHRSRAGSPEKIG